MEGGKCHTPCKKTGNCPGGRNIRGEYVHGGKCPDPAEIHLASFDFVQTNQSYVFRIRHWLRRTLFTCILVAGYVNIQLKPNFQCLGGLSSQ